MGSPSCHHQACTSLNNTTEQTLKFTYRATLVDRETGRLRNTTETIETDTWLARIADPARPLYGNALEIFERNLAPYARDEEVENFFSMYLNTYFEWKKFNIVLTFEYAMYMWAEYKAGRISSKVWAAVLSVAWQSGARGMLACVVLTTAQVREMFQAADRHTLLDLSSSDDEDMNALYDSLPETFTVYRGVSTGIDHFEDGFSWTRDMTEPMRFATLNCQSKKEIPGFITATIRKEAVLGLFAFEGEVVVDPAVPKLEVHKQFLRGNDLRKFHRQFDVEANTQDMLHNWAKR